MINYLKKQAQLSPKSEAVLKQYIHTAPHAKGEHLFRSDKVCDEIFFMQAGIARIYSIDEDGRDITEWFSPENTFVAPLDSFDGDKSFVSCELLEDAVVCQIKLADLNKLLDHNAELAKFAFTTLRAIFRLNIEIIRHLKYQSAKAKYEALLERAPFIFQRVPAMHIATFIGTSPETISRIRAGKV
ncbi:MAG: Crp/Fnr family transcriptional regulator [Mangrovibacterium sp.]